MTEEKIIEKVLKKAIKNGWNGLEMWSKTFEVSFHDAKSIRKWVWITYEEGDGESLPLRDLIFDHDFAKAFFGTKDVGCGHNGCGGCGNKCCGKLSSQTRKQLAYKYHLQQMIIVENPIKYLEQFTKPNN